MAVVIDNVYQKVLALANKEQRGYITPQEFNLFADRAQNEIYENYFYQLSVAEQKPKNQMQQSDSKEVIEQKLSFFIEDTSVTETNTGSASLSTIDHARIIKIIGNQLNANKVVERVSVREASYMLENPLTAPTTNRPIYFFDGTTDFINIRPINGTQVNNAYWVFHYVPPHAPNWGYVVVNEKALYNAPTSTNFELHVSEEENLVNKILILAGITIQKPDLQQAGAGQMQITQQQQNS